MAFPVEFFYFNKRINSTAQPDVPGATYQCLLKSPSSIVSPTLILQLPTAVNPSLYNYCYIEIYHRYYYVREMTFNDACWEIDLVVDPLASWKTNIGEYSGYILRSSSSYEGSIADSTYPTTNLTTYDEILSSESPWSFDSLDDGCFVVGILGTSTQYYIFPTMNAFNLFLEYIFSDVFAGDLVNDWDSVFPSLRAQVNPLQYISSIVWLPFKTTGDAVHEIQMGWVKVPVAAYAVNESFLRSGDLVLIYTSHKHPQASRGSYLNNYPYTTYKLFYPPWGLIDLNPDVMANTDRILAHFLVDIRTGEGTLIVYATDNTSPPMSWLHAQVGLPYQVSQVINKGNGWGNIVPQIASVAGSIAGGNAVGSIASTASAIESIASNNIPHVTSIGGTDGVNSLAGTPGLYLSFKHIVDEDFDHRGRPVCQVKQISSIPGFIMCADADIGIWGTVDEQQQIREYMEEGFFYE